MLPESPLAPAGDFVGTETVRHLDGCTYAGTIEATAGEEAVTIETLMIYDRRAQYLVRIEDDSRGFRLVKVGRVGGDPGGYFSHHWEAPGVVRPEGEVRLSGRTYMTSPLRLPGAHADVGRRRAVRQLRPRLEGARRIRAVSLPPLPAWPAGTDAVPRLF